MSKNNIETVTIPKAEYESLKSHCAQLESELNWLKEQLLINKKKTFGSSSERTEQLYQQMTLFFNEAGFRILILQGTHAITAVLDCL